MNIDVFSAEAVVIDDVRTNLTLMRAMGEKLGLTVQGFTCPADALVYMQENSPDIVFTDYMMADMNGLDVVRETSQMKPGIPIVMITAVDDETLLARALSMGASDFLKKPVQFTEFQARVINILKLRKARLELENHNIRLEEEVRRATNNILNREIESLMILARAAEFRDSNTSGHISRVAEYSVILGMEIGLSKTDIDMLYRSAPLHDVGKIGIPDSILMKPGPLSAEEFETMKTHTEIGYHILKNTKSKYLQAGGVIAWTHHEKFDGSGYPRGIKGDEIPVIGRIVAVADVFDALTTDRIYKKSWPVEEALQFMKLHSGTHFDPELVNAVFRNKDAFVEISENDQTDTDFFKVV